MSEQHDQHHAREPEVEPDHVDARMIAAVGGGTVVAIAISAVAAWLLAGGRAHGGGTAEPQRQPPPEVQAIDLQPFARTLEAERFRAAEAQKLERWTWSDRARGRVRAPLDLAIDRYLAAHAPSLARGGSR